jgi:hypothetical protein
MATTSALATWTTEYTSGTPRIAVDRQGADPLSLPRWQAPLGDRGRLFSNGRHHGSDPRGKPHENLSSG